MNITEIWESLRSSGVSGALQTVAKYPECNEKLLHLIQHCILEHSVGYRVRFDDEDQFAKNIDWLLDTAERHDIDPQFRIWLEYLDIGLQAPHTPCQRRQILNDLMADAQPIFVFKSVEMNPERRALVDFGLAITDAIVELKTARQKINEPTNLE